MIKCCYSTQHEGQGLNGVIGDSGGGQKYHETITFSLLETFFVICEYPLQTVWTKQYDFLILFLKDFFLKVSRRQQKHEQKLPSMQRVNHFKVEEITWVKVGEKIIIRVLTFDYWVLGI